MGRKKGRQRGNSSSKARNAHQWGDTLRDAREDLIRDRGSLYKGGKGGDSAPPRLSILGRGTLFALLNQRVREDQVATSTGSVLATKHWQSKKAERVVEDVLQHNPGRPRSLMSLCISQIGMNMTSS
ncbi:unnamed protein product [Choristocarpus tenellus]